MEGRAAINRTYEEKNLDKVNQNKSQRNSETFYEQTKNLGKSMISNRKTTIDYLPSSNNNRTIHFTEKNTEKPNIYQNKIGFLKSPNHMEPQKYHHTQGSHYLGQPSQGQIQNKKIQINFNGNQFFSSGKSYLNGDLT